MTKLTSTLNAVIDAATLKARSRKPKDIIPWLTHGKLRAKWMGDPVSFNSVICEGLYHAIRKRKKGNLSFIDEDDGQLSLPDMAEQWPEELRHLFISAGRKALTVPSRGDMVPVLPGVINGRELMEAAEFLDKKGKQTTDVAQRVRWFAMAVLKSEKDAA